MFEHTLTRALVGCAFTLIACTEGGDTNASQDVVGDATTMDARADTSVSPDVVAGSDAADAASDTLGDGFDPTTVPQLEAAIDCKKQGSAGGIASGQSLQRYNLPTADFPDALCNDGTPAFFYFRPAASAESANKWVIHLQGGGGCGSPQSCANRWCSVDTNFGAQGMSATLSPADGINAKGIQERCASNPLGDWNHIHIRYCSSDGWQGTARDVVLSAEHPRDGTPVTFRIHFLGQRIIEATLATLKGASGPLIYTLGATDRVMPNLDDADAVLLAGGSAGGAGVASNADYVRDALVATNTACQTGGACPLDYRVLIDSNFEPGVWNYDLSASSFCTEGGLCTYEALMQVREEFARQAQGKRWDASCVAHWSATDPPEVWRCNDTTFLVQNHVTSPMFVRMGLRDSLLSSNQIDAGHRYQNAPLTEDVFAALVSAQVKALADLQSTAIDGAAITTAPAAFAPPCRAHETLRDTAATFHATIDDPMGTPRTFFDVVGRWVMNQPAVLAADASTMTGCPNGNETCP